MPHYNSAKKWLARAAKDLRIAKLSFDIDDPDYVMACYLSQQCSEKSIKSFLALHGKRNIHKHDVSSLAGAVTKIDENVEQTLRSAATLDPYAVKIRYPDSDLEVDEEMSREAIEIASKVHQYFLERAEEYSPNNPGLL